MLFGRLSPQIIEAATSPLQLVDSESSRLHFNLPRLMVLDVTEDSAPPAIVNEAWHTVLDALGYSTATN